MSTPDFNDLTTPDELSDFWWKNHQSQRATTLAARWGARHGYEQARQLWPEPIIDRPPTEADGDEMGWVMRLTDRLWRPWKWDETDGDGWLHTPRWQPRQPTLQEQAIAAADEALQPANLSFTLQNADRLAAALSLIRRALEQAGEGVE
jgi:hypothetical protein